MKVNPLPARTWNWLKMNDTVLNENVMTERGNMTIEKPESVALAEEQNPELFSSIVTGMGKEMDGFFDAGKAATQIFTTKAGIKEAEPLRLTFTYEDGSRTVNRIGIHLLPDSELTVVMDFTSEEESEGTAAVQTKIFAEENAVLHLVQVQHLGKKFRILDDLGADCQKKAEVKTIQLILGGKDTYLGNYTALEGAQSSLESDIGYLAGGDGRVDMNLVALHTGKKLIHALEHPTIFRIFRMARKTGREAGHCCEFLRFRELEKGILFSVIAPQAQVLALIGEHFADRFPMEHFMIYDKTHQAMLVHEAGKEWVIWEHIEAFDETKLKLSDNEKKMSRGWQIFFDTIAIQERKNEKLQQQLLPLKYRPYQTEYLKKEEKCALFSK